MRDGQIRQVGSPWEIYKEPKTSFIAEFVGTSNFISGTKKDGKVKFEQLELTVSNLDDVEGEDVHLAVRPENVELVDVTISSEQCVSSNVFEVVAEVITFLGAVVRIAFVLEGETMIIDISEKDFGKMGLKRGGKIKVYFPPDAFHVYTELFKKLV
jgi:ABC-type Fe3+/spermidine/putrescine transport system ATPase subunit